ncbi:MAG: ankyrin repeat domain-containing protein [Gemmatimonadetes bacterium]|nr:ankyrin repeat domain-containing protein [Gemmatimonadota bacterium]
MLQRVKNAGLPAGALVAIFATTGLAFAPDSPVADAAQRGDLELVQSLLREGADVNAAQGDGMTALHWAAMNGDAAMIGVLLYAGSNVESTTRLGGYTPLHLASKGAYGDAVQALIEGGSRVDAITTTGTTSLHFAAASGSTDAIRALLASGADLDATEMANGQTALMFAAAAGRIEAVDVLLGAGADVSISTNVVDFAAKSEADGEARGRRQELMAAIRKAEAQARGEWVEDEDAGFNTRTDTPSGQAATRREAADRQQRDQTQGAGATPAQGAEGVRSSGEAPPGDASDRDPFDEDATDRDPLDGDPAPVSPAPDVDERLNAAADDARTAALEPLSYADIVGKQGGMTALHYAARDGHAEIVWSLLEAGADIDRRTEGDASTPLVVSIINGHYDMAMGLLERGANPDLLSEDGVGPLYAAIANRWAPKALYPQPTAFRQQQVSYLDLMETLLRGGADPNVRVATHIWYSAYNFDLLGVNFMGATPFWRAAKALDIPAMELLVAHGADPSIPSQKPPQRRRRRPADDGEDKDPSGLPPVEVGGAGIPPIVAAAGYGYGRSRTGNQHRHAPDSWLATARYLVEELGADVNARDHDGFSAVHFAAARGDNELILYLVEMGADPTVVARTGQTTVDMANGPIQRVQPFFETIELLEGMGAINNHNCLSC